MVISQKQLYDYFKRNVDNVVDVERTDIEKLIQISLNEFFANERPLLDVDANERSISFKLATYIQKHVPSDWNVDCEYNRDGNEPKHLGISIESIHSDDTEGKTVYPDIIVHKRKTKENLLIIEIKKSDSNTKNDIKKIQAFLNSDKYRYHFGLMLVIYTEKSCIGKHSYKLFPEI